MKRIIFILCAIFIAGTIAAQVAPPQAFNYSGVARDAGNLPIASKTIGVQLTLLKNNPTTGTVVYQENQFANTDGFGLFNLMIGTGAVQSGVFANIVWSNDNYYLRVGLDATGGTNFVTMGATQLLSVPYAIYAGSAGNTQYQTLSISNDTVFLTNGGFVKLPASSGGGGLVLPTITTSPATNITSNSATINVSITNANVNQITVRGICYDTLPHPNYDPNGFSSQSLLTSLKTNTFSIMMGWSPGLNQIKPNTTFFVRAFSVTENNTYVYGNEISFSTLPVGQAGQAGGIVFYDKGAYSNGWRYLESAPADQSISATWGCLGTLIGGTSDSIGSGKANTTAIINGCSTSGIAARLCVNYSLGGYTDWFLPSSIEAVILHQNLNLGNWYYWSSTEFDANIAFVAISFTSAQAAKDSTYYVRAVRAY